MFYGNDPEIEKLAQKFIGHLINADDFCKSCEDFDDKVKCDHCREKLKGYAPSIYYYEKVGENVPEFIEEPLEFLPKKLPSVDFLVVVGIHQDLLSGLPEYAEQNGIKAVIVPIENPKWVPPGLQVQVLKEFENKEIQAAFPKPFCGLSKQLNDLNQVGFHLTKEHDYIHEFIDYFQIGVPIVSFLLSKDGKSIENACVIQSAPCGSTYYVVQQLKSKYFENGKQDGLTLNERVSKAHHAYPCNASMDQDSVLKDTILHLGGLLIRNAVRKELGLEEEEGEKLKYVIK